MAKTTKKTPVKRKYVRKVKELKESKAAFKQALDEFKPSVPKELDELEFLDAIVLGMEQLIPEQKSRMINYLYSRYWMYITLYKLTQ